MDAEAEKLKAEQDKMQKDMDKFFDASGAVVSTSIDFFSCRKIFNLVSEFYVIYFLLF